MAGAGLTSESSPSRRTSALCQGQLRPRNAGLTAGVGQAAPADFLVPVGSGRHSLTYRAPQLGGLPRRFVLPKHGVQKELRMQKQIAIWISKTVAIMRIDRLHGFQFDALTNAQSVERQVKGFRAATVRERSICGSNEVFDLGS